MQEGHLCRPPTFFLGPEVASTIFFILESPLPTTSQCRLT